MKNKLTACLLGVFFLLGCLLTAQAEGLGIEGNIPKCAFQDLIIHMSDYRFTVKDPLSAYEQKFLLKAKKISDDVNKHPEKYFNLPQARPCPAKANLTEEKKVLWAAQEQQFLQTKKLIFLSRYNDLQRRLALNQCVFIDYVLKGGLDLSLLPETTLERLANLFSGTNEADTNLFRYIKEDNRIIIPVDEYASVIIIPLQREIFIVDPATCML